MARNLWREKSKYCCAQARFSEPVFLLFEEKGGKLMAGNFWREKSKYCCAQARFSAAGGGVPPRDDEHHLGVGVAAVPPLTPEPLQVAGPGGRDGALPFTLPRPLPGLTFIKRLCSLTIKWNFKNVYLWSFKFDLNSEILKTGSKQVLTMLVHSQA